MSFISTRALKKLGMVGWCNINNVFFRVIVVQHTLYLGIKKKKKMPAKYIFQTPGEDKLSHQATSHYLKHWFYHQQKLKEHEEMLFSLISSWFWL